MKNKIFTAFIAITIFLAGTAWIYGMVKAEREVKAVTWPITETSEVKAGQQEIWLQQQEWFWAEVDPNDYTLVMLDSERVLQIDNQVPDITFDTEDFLDWTDTTDPNFIWTTGGDIEFDWPICITNDVVVNTESGCEITINKVADKWVVAGDPNCYGDVIVALIESYFQQQESHDFWRKTNQKLLEEAIGISRGVLEKAQGHLEDAKRILRESKELAVTE